jgi:hypothetical protein
MSSRRVTTAVAAPVAALVAPAVLGVALTGCASGPVAEEVARYGPDTSGLVEPGLRVELGEDPDLRALGVSDGDLTLPPLEDGVRRFALTYDACELVGVEPDVDEDGEVRVDVEVDERVSCGQPQYWISVVDVGP